MADIQSRLSNWSTNEASNAPTGQTVIGSGLDDNLRQIQATVRAELANKGLDIASAATTDIGAVVGSAHNITGSTTITNLGTVSSGIWKVLQFNSTCVLKGSVSLVTPNNGGDVTAAPGDCAYVYSEGSGVWRIPFFQRSSGRALTPANYNSSVSTSVNALTDLMPIWSSASSANMTVTVNQHLNVINDLTVDASPDTTNDYLLSYDTSASAVKKVTPISIAPNPTAAVGASTVLLQKFEFSSSTASIEFSSTAFFSGTYQALWVKMVGIRPATNGATLLFRVSEDNGATYKSGASDYGNISNGINGSGTGISISGSATSIQLGGGINSTAGQNYEGDLWIHGPQATSSGKRVYGNCSYIDGTGAANGYTIRGNYVGTTNPINAIRFVMSAGNIAVGNFYLYGLKTS